MITYKETWTFLKRLYAIIAWEIDFFRGQHKLREMARNYKPKHTPRTLEECQRVRDRIRKDPATCKHLKGGNLKTIVRDFNLSHHTFIDGSQRIICNFCGKKWFKDSPDWNEAVKMFEQSTNMSSASEQVPTAWRQIK
jgi:hypothetical protein